MYSQIDKITPYLLDNVIEHDSAAMHRFVELTEKTIYGAIHQFNGLDHHEIADLFQTIYLKLFEDDMRRIKLWKGDSEFRTYLYRIVLNLVKDYLGSAWYQNFSRTNIPTEQPQNDRDTVQAVADNPTPDEVLQTIEVTEMIAQLREVEKTIIRYYYFEGFKEREIAAMMDFPLNTVSSIKNRALKKMKIRWDKHQI